MNQGDDSLNFAASVLKHLKKTSENEPPNITASDFAKAMASIEEYRASLPEVLQGYLLDSMSLFENLLEAADSPPQVDPSEYPETSSLASAFANAVSWRALSDCFERSQQSSVGSSSAQSRYPFFPSSPSSDEEDEPNQRRGRESDSIPQSERLRIAKESSKRVEVLRFYKKIVRDVIKKLNHEDQIATAAIDIERPVLQKHVRDFITLAFLMMFSKKFGVKGFKGLTETLIGTVDNLRQLPGMAPLLGLEDVKRQ